MTWTAESVEYVTLGECYGGIERNDAVDRVS